MARSRPHEDEDASSSKRRKTAQSFESADTSDIPPEQDRTNKAQATKSLTPAAQKTTATSRRMKRQKAQAKGVDRLDSRDARGIRNAPAESLEPRPLPPSKSSLGEGQLPTATATSDSDARTPSHAIEIPSPTLSSTEDHIRADASSKLTSPSHVDKATQTDGKFSAANTKIGETTTQRTSGTHDLEDQAWGKLAGQSSAQSPALESTEHMRTDSIHVSHLPTATTEVTQEGQNADSEDENTYLSSIDAELFPNVEHVSPLPSASDDDEAAEATANATRHPRDVPTELHLQTPEKVWKRMMRCGDRDIIWEGGYLKALDYWTVKTYCIALRKEIYDLNSAVRRNATKATSADVDRLSWRHGVYWHWAVYLGGKEPVGAVRDKNGVIIPLDETKPYPRPRVDTSSVTAVENAIFKLRQYIARLCQDPVHCQRCRVAPDEKYSLCVRGAMAHREELSALKSEMLKQEEEARSRQDQAREREEAAIAAACEEAYRKRSEKRDAAYKTHRAWLDTQECWRCHEFGHTKDHCPNVSRPQSPRRPKKTGRDPIYDRRRG